MSRARLVSAKAFAASGALVGMLFAAAVSSFSMPGVFRIPLDGPVDLLMRLAIGAGLLSVLWAVVGAGAAPFLMRARRLEVVAAVGIAVAVVAVGGILLPLYLAASGDDAYSRAWRSSADWVDGGVTLVTVFVPFGIWSATSVWLRLHRTEPL